MWDRKQILTEQGQHFKGYIFPSDKCITYLLFKCSYTNYACDFRQQILKEMQESSEDNQATMWLNK